MAEAVKKEYEASLSDLTFNSKPLINMLTMLAEENIKYARQIVDVIEARLQKAKPTEKLPVLYLVDSIIKNMKGPYLEAFTPNIVRTFSSVFEKVDEKTRLSLFKLRQTWASYFPPKKLYAMDLKVKELDPAWPIFADPNSAKQPAASIHVNPKFIKKPSVEPAKPPALSAPTPTVRLSEEELAELKKKESERQEMEMRQQLIKKQEQLLQLQQQRLEFELQQTQSRLEEQAQELKQKNEQLIFQQQALQQQAIQQQQQQQAVAAPWPAAQPAMNWPASSLAMVTGHAGVAVIPGQDPVLGLQAQGPGFLPPPPVPPFNQPVPQPPQQPPMHPVLPMQQVPPVPQVPQSAPPSRDPRVTRDPRLARRDARLRGSEPPSTAPASVPSAQLAVATVPPVQSATTASVSVPQALPTVTSSDTPQPAVQQLKSVVTIAPSVPSVKPNAQKLTEKGHQPAKEVKSAVSKLPPADKKVEAKLEAAPSDKKDAKTETKLQETKAADGKSDPKAKSEAASKSAKANERSPRRSSDDKRDARSDAKPRDRVSREPERRTSRDSKKDFDKRDSWSVREREKDSRERDREYRDRLKERAGGSRESSRIPNSRRRSNRSRSRSRSPISRSRSPRGSDKPRPTTTRAAKVDKFGRDMPRPVKETKEEKKPASAPDTHKAEKKADGLPGSRKADKKHDSTVDTSKKDIDERVKPKASTKENLLGSKPDVRPGQDKAEKRRSVSPCTDSDRESKAKGDVPNKRPRLDKESSSDESSKNVSEEMQKPLSLKMPQDRLRDGPPGRDLLALRQAAEARGWGRVPPHPADRHDHERMLMSPDGRRDRLSSRRRPSIDPSIHIPKELALEKHAFILKQAEKQLHSGELSHQQHQELLRELSELHQHQRQQQDDRYEELHPHDPYRRRHPDDLRHRYGPRAHEDPRDRDVWPRSSDVDHRRFPNQDVDMRVFDAPHPMHGAATKPRAAGDPAASAVGSGKLSLPAEDQDERILPKDRDDRVKAPPNEVALPAAPLKSILKPRKPLPPLDSPLSPEPAEKRGNDSKVKTEGEASDEAKEKEETLTDKKDKPEAAADEKESPPTDHSEDAPNAEDAKSGEASDDAAKGKDKKKNKKKKKKGKGNKAEVHVEVSAFEESLEIKPPVFDSKKPQPLMDMDERRNSTDNEPANVLPAPFQEADDLEVLFPAGKDRDERRRPGPQEGADREGRPPRDGSGLEGKPRKGPIGVERSQTNPPSADPGKDDSTRDPRLQKGPLLTAPLRDNPPRPEPGREAAMGSFAEDEHYRHHSFPGRHPAEAILEEGSFRDRLPRDHPLRRSPPRGLRGAPHRDGRDGMERSFDFDREHPFRDRPPFDGPPSRDGHFRVGHPGWERFKEMEGHFRERDGPFREDMPRRGPPSDPYHREGPYRDGGRGGPYRDSDYRGFPPREGFPRDGPPMEGRFRDGAPWDGPFRDGPSRERAFRDGHPMDGPFRDGPSRDRSFRDGPPLEGPFRDGPFRDSRRSPPRDEEPFRGGPGRTAAFRGMHGQDGPPREGEPRGSPGREGPFREGPPREAFVRRSPSPTSRDGPPGRLREPWDPRRGPPPDLREEGGGQLRLGPLVDAQNLPSDERDQRVGMADSDERKHADQRALDHMPLPPRTAVEIIDKPPAGPLPHPSAQQQLPMGHPLGLPQGLRVPHLAMLPIQALAEQAKANLQAAGGTGPPVRGLLPPGGGFPMPGGLVPGMGFGGPRPPMPDLSLPGMAPMLQRLPVSGPGGNVVLSGSMGLQGQPLFDQHAIPTSSQPLHLQQMPVPPGIQSAAMMGAPHLRPDNMMGTPPLQQPAALDINSLFAKLVGAGILPPTRSDSPVVPGTGTPPPQGAVVKEETEASQPDPEEDLFVPELGMYPEELKIRYDGVINRIYTGTQCSSCGMRFVIDEMDKYRKHLDWHFRQNRRDKDGVKAVQSRKWFYEVDQWLDYEEINDIDEERSNFFEEMALQSRTDKDGVHCVAIDASIEGDEMCSLCHEAFEQFFDEDEEVWKLRDAVRFNKRTFHPGCYEDAKDASILDTPTPGEERLNSSFDASFGPLSAYSQTQAALQQLEAQRLNTSKATRPTEPTDQPTDQPTESKADLRMSSKPLSSDQPKDLPKESQLGQDASTDSVDSKEDVKTSLPAPDQSADRAVDVPNTSQPPDSFIVKTEPSEGVDAAQPVSEKQETDQPMETETTAPVQQDGSPLQVKAEPSLEPEVKMEVDGSDIAIGHPHESISEMEVTPVAPSGEDRTEPAAMETSPQAVSTVAGDSVKPEPEDIPDHKPDAAAESVGEISESVTALPSEGTAPAEPRPELPPSPAPASEQSPGEPASDHTGTVPSSTQLPGGPACEGVAPQDAEPSSEGPPSDPAAGTPQGHQGTEETGASEKDPGVAGAEAQSPETLPSQPDSDAVPPERPDAADTGEAADTKVDAAQMEVDAAETEVDVADTKVDVTDTKVDVTDTKVDVTDTNVDAADTKVDAAQTEVDAEETDVADMNVDAAETKMDAADAKVDAADMNVDAADTKVDAADTKVDAADTKVDAADTKVDAADTKVDAVDTKVDAADTKVDAADTKVDAADTKVDTKDTKEEAADQPSDETWSGEEPKAEAEAKPSTAAGEVQNIQAISVIGRTRMSRRDMFYR